MMQFTPVFVFFAGLTLFLGMWYRESRISLLFTPFLLFSINDIARNWIAAAAAPSYGVTTDFYALYLFIGAYTVFAITFLITGAALRYPSRLAVDYRARPVAGGVGSVHGIVLVSAAAALTMLGLYFFKGLPVTTSIGLDFLRSGGSVETAAVIRNTREALTKAHVFGGAYAGQGVILTVLRTCWPILVAAAWLRWREERTRFWALVTAVCLALAIIFIGGDGTRGHVLWSLIFLLVLVSLVQPIPRWVALAGAAALVLVAIGLSVVSSRVDLAVGGVEFWLQAVKEIAGRAFFGNGFNTVNVTDLVREGVWNLRLGDAHMQKFIAALPGPGGGPPLAYELYKTMDPTGHSTTFASATYLAEAYLDVGVIGACAAYAFAGMCVAVVQYFVFSRGKSTLATPFAAFVVLAVGRLPLSGPVGVITATVIAAFFCFALWAAYSVLLGAGHLKQEQAALASATSEA